MIELTDMAELTVLQTLHPLPVLQPVFVDAMIELTDVAEPTVAQTGSTRCRCSRLCRWKQTDGRNRQR